MKTWEMLKLNLKGSDKQIKWATDIISGVYATVNSNNRRAHDLQWPHADKLEEVFEQIIFQLEGFLAKTEKASAIIACRERLDGERILFLANKMVQQTEAK